MMEEVLRRPLEPGYRHYCSISRSTRILSRTAGLNTTIPQPLKPTLTGSDKHGSMLKNNDIWNAQILR